jgi:hypothetical protein
MTVVTVVTVVTVLTVVTITTAFIQNHKKKQPAAFIEGAGCFFL